MKNLKIFMLLIGLLFVISCSNIDTGNEERNPRETMEFFYRAEEEEEEPERTRVYYHGEHFFKD